MTTTQEAPEGERLVRLETAVESLVREVSDAKADIRQIHVRMDSLHSEMGQIHGRMDSLHSEMGQIHGRMDSLLSEMSKNFRWTIGILAPLILTLIITLLLRT